MCTIGLCFLICNFHYFLLSSQSLFMGQSRAGIEKIIATTQSALGDGNEPVDTTKPYTLEQYSIDHFRVPKPRTLSGSLRGGIRRKDAGQIWTFSRVCTTSF